MIIVSRYSCSLTAGLHRNRSYGGIERRVFTASGLPTAYMHRAALLLLVGQQDQAKLDFERVLQLAPEHPQAKYDLQTLAQEDSQ